MHNSKILRTFATKLQKLIRKSRISNRQSSFQGLRKIGQYTGGVTADIRSGIVATKAEPEPSANNQLYNLAGQKVNASYKGIVIQNGKKQLYK